MRVICTHEQADFDATASIFAAALLFQDSYIILPARLNRNVLSFLNLYGSEFPFIQADDLPHEQIDHVILVDTQSMITLKGLKADAAIFVFDHHPARPKLSKAWNFTFEAVGACTTQFVEMLQKTGLQMNSIQSTLLLLGIYEDTGSLTYSNTTVRDVNAVALLFEHGANIKLVSEFLNPPLSVAQRKVYDQLLSKIETIQIEGQTITIACAQAEELTDEVSSIAHKLRDLLDPDGLFLIIRTKEGLRLIARSTSDHVNSARIMSAFHGGGHERAASALVRSEELAIKPDDSLHDTVQKLKEVLRKEIQPTLMVAEIMSPKPHTISPSMTAEEAATLMQRYGYEGFPVVDDGKIVGLLTRRAVDRAKLHNLNLKTSSLMDAGQVFVLTSDSIEAVQKLMADSGWGQIPVVDKQGKVVGIVTRTDLLKVLAGNQKPQSNGLNLADRLDRSLSSIKLALLKEITTEADKMSVPIFLVGGFVRDLILEIPSLDFDLVVEGDAIQLTHNLATRFGGSVVSHSRFGTAKWRLSKQAQDIIQEQLPIKEKKTGDLPGSIDLISARMETYDHPTALPTVEHGNLRMDLHRRDFTINTLALRLERTHYGEVVDHWGGLNDLRSGLIRVLHPLSFIDDPTRMLRAIRFEQRFSFQLEERTAQFMIEAQPLLQQVSGSRIRHELDLILEEQHPEKVLARAAELGLLVHIHTDLLWSEDISQRVTLVRKHAPVWQIPEKIGTIPRILYSSYLVWLGEHHCESAIKIANRLRFPGEFQRNLKVFCSLKTDSEKLRVLNPSAITHRLENAAPIVLSALEIICSNDEFKEKMMLYRTSWSKIKLFTNGDHLKSLGVEPGPLFRRILESLKNAWIDGKISSKMEEEELLSHLVEMEKLKKGS